MESFKKILKVLNPLLSVAGVVAVVLGIFKLIYDGLGGLGSITADMGVGDAALGAIAVALVAGTVLIVCGFMSLATGLFGIRGGLASKGMLFYTAVAVIAAIVELVGFIYSIANGAFDWVILINLLLVVVCAVLAVIAKFVKKQ